MAKTKNTKMTPNGDGSGWAYGEITVDDIVDAAIDIVRAEGVGGLTMRRLSETLNMSPMAPYYYIKSKKVLLDLLIDRVVGEIQAADLTGDWKAKYRAMILSAHEVFNRYPGIVPLMQGRAPTGEQQRLTAQSRLWLTEAGLDDDAATRVSLFGLSYLFGSLTTERVGRTAKAGARPAKRSLDEQFEFGVDFFLRAVEAEAKRHRAAVRSR